MLRLLVFVLGMAIVGCGDDGSEGTAVPDGGDRDVDSDDGGVGDSDGAMPDAGPDGDGDDAGAPDAGDERVDEDGDAVAAEDDCDDGDPSLGARAADMDCDGALGAFDCDDSDPALGAKSADMDCDGVIGADDCDDRDTAFGDKSADADCDGVLTADDCDDDDAALGATSEDVDCDGTLTADDCDDDDAALGATADDADCDGVLTADDCDDDDAAQGPSAADMDCDGVLTADDCDDSSTSLGATAADADCDSVLTADDCDDADASLGATSADADCDGVLTADDCDDSNASLGATAADADCDGVLTADDCDDADAALGDLSTDADCDGAITADDCDDGDAAVGATASDQDCDGVPSVLDCDDTVAGTWDANDADCDGTPDVVTFEKADYADPTDMANQDCVDPAVCLTRGDRGALFNGASETSAGPGSPSGASFATGFVGQGAAYGPFASQVLGGDWTLQPHAMHVSGPDQYYNVLAYRWTQRQQGGGFSWGRARALRFEKADFADASSPANQDCLVPGVCLTRGDTMSLYNAVDETSSSNSSPSGTEWAPMRTAMASPSDYTTFSAVHGSNPRSALRKVLSLHIVGTDVYYDVVLTGYTGGGPGGGFSYVRSRALVAGCTNSAEANYDPKVTVDNGLCGDWVRFDVPNDPDPSDPNNHDCLTPEVCLTRGKSQGLYNTVRQDSYGRNAVEPVGGPAGTLWAKGDSSTVVPGDFTNWVTAMANCPPCNSNQVFTVWLPLESRMFELEVVRWAADGNGGGVTYFRREVPLSFTCGDGTLELGEQCDDGNSDDLDGCQSNCLLPQCGDGVLDPGEACDEGSASSDKADASCRLSCRLPSCADGILDSGEVCDDGNVFAGDGCDACVQDCRPETGAVVRALRPGDGQCVLSFDEQVTRDAASIKCDGVGGDLVTITDVADQTFFTEVAMRTGDVWIGYTDRGTEGTFSWESGSTANYTSWATNEPSVAGADDCVINLSSGGWDAIPCSRTSGYACETRCGNGVVDPGEACDLGAQNEDVAGSACLTNCKLMPECGDGLVDYNEDCDDGNTIDGDGCQADCSLACGQGLGSDRTVVSPTDGACFLYYPAVASHPDAETNCVGIGGHLATIADAAEESAIALLTPNNFWFGYTDAAVEGTFAWLDGTAAGYENWATGEPNNFGSGEDCAAYDASGWNDVPCIGTSLAYVCEIP